MERKEIKKCEMRNSLSPRISKETADFAKDRGIYDQVKKATNWIFKKVGRGFVGSVAIGKGYSTLVLDIAYEDGAIHISCDTDKITFRSVEVVDYKQFITEFDKYYIVA